MTEPRYDVLAIGNAIVDVLASTEDDFLVAEGLAKGTMHLIGPERAETLHRAMKGAVEKSGGSAGNTAAGVASFGGRAAFIGKVADDALGDLYRRDMHESGVDFATPALSNGAPTARSMILITPDGERTMNTYLGACQSLGPDDIDPEVVRASAVTYLEGYLWDPPEAKKAFIKAAEIAHQAGRKVSLTLSDPFCVDRYRGEFLDLIRWKTVDILFANDSELRSLYETANLETAIAALRADGALAVVTVGADGAIVITAEAAQPVAAAPVERIADLTGAGDLFAAGFLYGMVRGMDLAEAARLGNLAAGEVIGHIGPRPATSLKALAERSAVGMEFPT
jgi:sugar/nucleoside kinase (ribokinase family)